MSPLVQLTLAVSLAPSSADYERLARRVAAWVLDPALDDAGAETLDAARNACTALALVAAATAADALRAFVSTFTHRRDLRERGFCRLTDEQIDFLARLCVFRRRICVERFAGPVHLVVI